MEPDNGLVLNVTDDVKLDVVAETIRSLRQDSATGTVNTVEADSYFVLRSAELAGWYVKWPSIEGGDEDDDNFGYELSDDFMVN
ncbi:TPA: hypothetical protein ACS29Y_005696 [Raoultella planticola]|uniref:hypothetical protein n=1 Tax=Raoultella planticola TaxID=575 RepID=UPI001CBFAE63|nr:hypothetical protein [Raoultella planticola]